MTPEALAALHASAFDAMPRPWSADEFAALLAEPATCLVAGPAGFALGRSIGPEAELLTIAVAPDARGRGTGARLLIAFEALAAARGAETVFLEVARSNGAARRLYGRLGYAVAGRRPDYYRSPGGVPVDALVLRKSLGGAGREEPSAATSGSGCSAGRRGTVQARDRKKH